jgi:hypothetical protein
MRRFVSVLTLLHVVISLVALFAGLVVFAQLVANQHKPGWVSLFLWTTVATSVTGFIFFPLKPTTPAHAFGIVSLIVLALVQFALHARRLAGGRRKTNVI